MNKSTYNIFVIFCVNERRPFCRLSKKGANNIILCVIYHKYIISMISLNQYNYTYADNYLLWQNGTDGIKQLLSLVPSNKTSRLHCSGAEHASFHEMLNTQQARGCL